MPSKRVLLGFTVANLGILWQWQLKDIIYNTFGVSRVLEPLDDFPYTCRRINDHNLAACEDAWLDESSRTLFLACSNALGRKAWNPNIAHFAAERRSQHDHIVAMSIDSPSASEPASYDYNLLDLGTFTNALGDPAINLVGMSGVRTPSGDLNLYFINAAPTYNATTALLAPQAVTGANATIEAFTLPSGSTTLKHLHTFYDPNHITTPNRPAALPDGSIYLTNDHGPHKVGLSHVLSPVIRNGNIAHCLPPSSPGGRANCHHVGGEHAFPNGLTYSSKHNLVFVPSSVTGQVTVYEPNTPASGNASESTLTRLADIPTTYPLDNISEDANGDLYIAGFPKLNQMMEHTKVSTPIDGTSAPSVVLRLKHKQGGGKGEWEVSKALEDGLAQTLPAATTVVRDAKTGRLFVVGVVSPWITVCEPTKS